jgi:hypothetical protein
MCGRSTCDRRRKTHDLHLGGGKAGDDRQCRDVLHYDYGSYLRERKRNVTAWAGYTVVVD